MNTLDWIARAAAQYRVYGRRGIQDTFHQMDDLARIRFDWFLVKTEDQLATFAGTTESRFTCRVLAMALNRPAVNAMGMMDLSEGER